MSTIKGFIKRHGLSGGEAGLARRMLSEGKSHVVVINKLLDMGSDEVQASMAKNVFIEAKQLDIFRLEFEKRGNIKMAQRAKVAENFLRKSAERLVPESHRQSKES